LLLRRGRGSGRRLAPRGECVDRASRCRLLGYEGKNDEVS
jgi:hypothetical protein